LRAKGHVIFGKWESVKNRFGGETQMMRYFHGGSV